MAPETPISSTVKVPESTFTKPATEFARDNSTFTLPSTVLTFPSLEAEQVGSTLRLPSATIVLPTTNIDLSEDVGPQRQDNDCPASFSAAEASGIGVGSALGGITLAAAAIALYLRFKGKPRRNSVTKIYHESRTINRPHLGVSAPSNRVSGSRRNAVDDLPQRKGDNEYQHQIERLRTGIKNCVENFFVAPHALEDEHTALLRELAGGNPNSSRLIYDLSSRNTYQRSCAIRALVAQLLFDRFDPAKETTVPLLPPALLAVYRALRTSPAQGRRARSRSIGNESDRKELVQTWRQITGAYMPRDLLRQQTRLAVEDMALTLGCLRPASQEDFEAVLHDLGMQATSLGLALFTIPEQWSPVWTPRTPHSAEHLVVFPGVELHTHGNEMRRPLTEPYME